MIFKTHTVPSNALTNRIESPECEKL